MDSSPAGSAHQEPLPQFVAVLERKLGSARVECPAADAGDDGGVLAGLRRAGDRTGETRTDDALEDPRLADAIWPLACMAASRAVTPEPVGERSTSASANTQTFLVGRSEKLSSPSVRIEP